MLYGGKMHWVVACDSQGNGLYRLLHTDTGVYQRKIGGNVHGPKTNLENPGVDHSQRIWSLGSTVCQIYVQLLTKFRKKISEIR